MTDLRWMVLWLVCGLSVLVAGTALLTLAVRRFGPHLKGVAVETPLFRRLAEVHGLSPSERKVLLELARRRGDREPALFFVSPTALSQALSQGVLGSSGLRARLFGQARG